MTLSELRKRVEGASGPDREMDLDLALALGLAPTGEMWKRRKGRYNQGGHPELREDRSPAPGPWPTFTAKPYSSSLDAALSLVERKLPGWVWSVDSAVGLQPAACWMEEAGGHQSFAATASTPALAVLAALLTALDQPEPTV